MKTRVLSVRLDLATLQSCFDLCDALNIPQTGASGAIASTLKLLLSDMRNKQSLPSYTEEQLRLLAGKYAGKINPTSQASLERLTDLDFAPYSVDAGLDRTGLDRTPRLERTKQEPEQLERDLQREEQEALEEYNDLLEQSIRELQKESEEDLLKRIMIGG